VAVGWDQLAQVGVGPLSRVAVWIATSSTAAGLNGDFVWHDASTEGDPNLSDVGDNGTTLDPDGGDGTATSPRSSTATTGPSADTGAGQGLSDALEPLLEGGGGCSTGPGSAVAGFVVLLVARRRAGLRRRAARRAARPAPARG
jgi:hypothetical protein